MSTKIKPSHCHDCDKNVIGEKQTPNHILHLILTVISAGLWVVVWIIIAAISAGREYQCRACGSKVVPR